MDIWFKCNYCSFCTTKKDKCRNHSRENHPKIKQKLDKKESFPTGNGDKSSGKESENLENGSKNGKAEILLAFDKNESIILTENGDKNSEKESENSENGSKNGKSEILQTLDKNETIISTVNAEKSPGNLSERSEFGSKEGKIEILQSTPTTTPVVKETEFICEICLRSFQFKRNLMKHQLVHNANGGKKVVQISNRKSSLRSRDRVLEPNEIDKIQNQRNSRQIEPKISRKIRTRTKSNTNTKPKKVIQISNKTSSLRLRKRVVQPKELDKSQNQSNSRQIETKIRRKLRTKSTTKNKPKIRKKGKHICQVCKKCFNHPPNLEIHERIHNNERPYKCTKCPKSFIQLSNVQAHIRIHLKDKPYKCTTCNKKFRQLSGLQVHQRLHTGIKPYKCHCGAKYRQLSNLREHKKREHPDPDSI